MNNVQTKICLILPGLDAGGIENYVLRYLNYLKDPSRITVMARNSAKGDLFEKYQQTGVVLHRQQVSYFNPLKWFLLFRFFKKQKFAAVCDFNENFAGIPMLMAALAGTPKRITFYRRSSHAFAPGAFRLLYARLMNFLVYRYSTAILSNSKHAFDFFFGQEKSEDTRFKVIPNGISFSAFDLQLSKEEARKQMQLPQEAFILGHSGRYDPAKNHETWFKVAQVLSQKYPDMRFLFCGKGTNSEAFTLKLQEYGIAKNTYAMGISEEVGVLLRAMDLFYFPSVTEGQPNALVEALLSGLPVVTANIKPIKEIMPETAQNLMIDPLSVNCAVEEIEKHYSKKADYDSGTLKRWAKEKFGAAENFKKFENELG